MTKKCLKVFNITLKLYKALLVTRLQVEGGADIRPNTNYGVYCSQPLPGQFRASSFTSPSTRRTAAGYHYYKLMGQYFITRRTAAGYHYYKLMGQPYKQPPLPAFYALNQSFFTPDNVHEVYNVWPIIKYFHHGK